MCTACFGRNKSLCPEVKRHRTQFSDLIFIYVREKYGIVRLCWRHNSNPHKSVLVYKNPMQESVLKTSRYFGMVIHKLHTLV